MRKLPSITNKVNAVTAIDEMKLQKMFASSEDFSFSLAKCPSGWNHVATNPLLQSQELFLESPNH